jgi:hypothetical protein
MAVLVDISFSMDEYMAPLSQAAWILPRAGHGSHLTCTTIAFGPTITVINRPGRRPGQVLEMQAFGGTDTFRAAIGLADWLLHLRRPGPIRLLVVVSDGMVSDIDRSQHLISTLHREGVQILWLQPDVPLVTKYPQIHTFDDTTTIRVTDPAASIEIIANAMITALLNA